MFLSVRFFEQMNDNMASLLIQTHTLPVQSKTVKLSSFSSNSWTPNNFDSFLNAHHLQRPSTLWRATCVSRKFVFTWIHSSRDQFGCLPNCKLASAMDTKRTFPKPTIRPICGKDFSNSSKKQSNRPGWRPVLVKAWNPCWADCAKACRAGRSCRNSSVGFPSKTIYTGWSCICCSNPFPTQMRKRNPNPIQCSKTCVNNFVLRPTRCNHKTSLWQCMKKH